MIVFQIVCDWYQVFMFFMGFFFWLKRFMYLKGDGCFGWQVGGNGLVDLVNVVVNGGGQCVEIGKYIGSGVGKVCKCCFGVVQMCVVFVQDFDEIVFFWFVEWNVVGVLVVFVDLIGVFL